MDVVEAEAPPPPPREQQEQEQQEQAQAPVAMEEEAAATNHNGDAATATAAPAAAAAAASGASGVVREAQAFLERLALSCENRAVPAEGERAEVSARVSVGINKCMALTHSHLLTQTTTRYSTPRRGAGGAGP
jgi:hypothetical protein